MKPKEQSWWDLELARLKELYDNDSDMPCGILIEFERCKAQNTKDIKALEQKHREYKQQVQRRLKRLGRRITRLEAGNETR